MPLNIAILGVSGRMGQTLVREISLDRRLELTGGIVRSDSEYADCDIGEMAGIGYLGRKSVVRLEDGAEGADVLIDVSLPDATIAAAKRLAKKGAPAMVTGVTGLTEDQSAELAEAAKSLPILVAGNFSVGVTILEDLVRQAAAALPFHRWDTEIIETHHRAKLDAPSGTALLLGEAVAEARGQALDQVASRGRDGHTGYRPPGTIGFAAVRGGSVIGEHEVRFLSDFEEITLTHAARDRRVFALGALDAARWINGKPAGLYTMRDMIAA